MPCTAPVRGKTDLKYPWKPSINNDPCGVPDVYAGGLCRLHWQMANGPIPSTSDPATMLLLHMNGADGSTAFVDSSYLPKAVTAAGTAQVDTAQSRFGGSSLLTAPDGNYLSLADSPDFALGAGDFTIEFWVRFNGFASYQDFMGQRASGQDSWVFTRMLDNTVRFLFGNDGALGQALFAPWTPVLNTWYHVALVRTGAVLRFYINGAQIGTDGSIGTTVLFDSTAPLLVGSGLAGAYCVDGWMDEVRISKVARWTANFTPPTAPY